MAVFRTDNYRWFDSAMLGPSLQACQGRDFQRWIPPSLYPPPKKRARPQRVLEPGIYLATTYSHRTYRPTTIGAAAFHFRVRNGTGWFHHALVTRGQFWGRMAGATDFKTGTLGILSSSLISAFQHFCFQLLPIARSLASIWRFF